MKKANFKAMLLILIIGLSACSDKTATSSNSQPAQSLVPVESSVELPEIEEESLPYWWKSPQKPTPETAGQIDYWQVQFRYIDSTYPDKYERDNTSPSLYNLAMLMHRDGILEQLSVDENGFAILEWEDCRSLLALYFGSQTATEITIDDFETYIGTYVDHIDREGERLFIRLIEQFIEPSKNIGRELAEVTPLDENSNSIELVINVYDIIWSTDERVLSAKQHYILRWGGAVGYFAESAYWEYVPTDRVSISDNVREIATLWDVESTGYAYQTYRGQANELESSSQWGHPIHVHGEDVYQFRIEDNRIVYNQINLETLEQSMGHTLLSAESHLAYLLWRVGDGIVIFADNTLYQFDGTLRLQKQVAVPESVRMAWDTAIDEQFTKAAYFVDNDLYLYDLVTQESRLIYTHVYDEQDSLLDGRFNSLYAVRFTEKGHIFIGISGWEAFAYQYLIISQDGDKLAEMNGTVSEEHSGGYSFSNYSGAFHNYYFGDDRASWQYLNFSSLELKKVKAMPFDFSGGIGMVTIPSPQNRHQWYFSEPRGNYQMPDETAFHLIDFDSETFTELPLLVTGARASLMAVSESERLLFNYAYNGERGFGVYTPNITSNGEDE